MRTSVLRNLRQLELQATNAPRNEHSSVERAFNILGDPELRACYDRLLKDPEAPALFPYGGFGSLLVSGERSRNGNTFFAHWKEETSKVKKLLIQRDLIDPFDKVPLENFDKFTLQVHLNKLAQTRSRDRVLQMRATCGTSFVEAVDQDFLSKDPARKVRVPSQLRETDKTTPALIVFERSDFSPDAGVTGITQFE